MSEELTVSEKLKKMIREQLGVREDEIQPDSSFVDTFGADSLDMVELQMTVEDEYDFEIPDEEFESVLTVQNLVDLIEKRNITA